MSTSRRLQCVPENAPGDFYVQAGLCLQCCLPHEEAPELMNDCKQLFRECYFRRQPQTPEEVERAIQAIWISEMRALCYGGTDQTIIRRLHELSAGDCCDHPLLGQPVQPPAPPPPAIAPSKPWWRRLLSGEG